MAAKKLPVFEIGKGNKLKKTGSDIAVDAFTPIGHAASERAQEKAESGQLKRRPGAPLRRVH